MNRTDQDFDPREVWAAQQDEDEDTCICCGDYATIRQTDSGRYCLSCGQLQEND